MPGTYHDPVLLQESVDALSIVADGTYVDATFGGGGHSKEILKRLGAKGRLIAFDRDDDAIQNKPDDERLVLVNHNFKYMKKFLRYHDAIPVDGIIADLGISSHQINEPARGFSTRFEAALDMRMNRETSLTAAEVVNTYDAAGLTRIFSSYGEIRNSRTLTETIVTARKKSAIETIDQLKSAIASCTDRGFENQYYAKVFQAIRIEVNDELGALKELLLQSPHLVRKGGRLVFIAYHSLEDRLIKNFVAKGKFEGELEKDLFGNTEGVPFHAVNKKPMEATEAEIAANPRARSAKLRIAERN